MIINHNMSAINANNVMAKNQTKTGKILEKLSSGMRINRAADDAAGLSISEKMRAQIRGLDQAARNANEGISLIQTAEGALGEVHEMIKNMRDKLVQAANDTNTTDDRKALQDYVNAISSEVNRVGNTTEYNTMKLLHGGEFGEDSGGGFDPEVPGSIFGEMYTDIMPGKTKTVHQHSSTITITTGKTLDFDFESTITSGITVSLKIVGTGVTEGATFNSSTNTIEISILSSSQTGDISGLATLVQTKIDSAIETGALDKAEIYGSVTVGGSGAYTNKAASTIAGTPSTPGESRDYQQVYSFAIKKGETLSVNIAGKMTSQITVKLIVSSSDTVVYDSGSKTMTISVKETAIKDAYSLNGLAKHIQSKIDSTGTTLSDKLGTINITGEGYSLPPASGMKSVGLYESNLVPDETKWITKTVSEPGAKMHSFQIFYPMASSGSITFNLMASANTTGGSAQKSATITLKIAKDGDVAPSEIATAQASAIAEALKEKLKGTGLSAAFTVTVDSWGQVIITENSAGMTLGSSEVSKTEVNSLPDSDEDDETSSAYTAKLQIGANTGQSMTVKIDDMRALALGITSTSAGDSIQVSADGTTWEAYYTQAAGVTDGTNDTKVEYALDVSDHDKATAAIKVMNDALGKVSDQRSRLGALQNRLEHAINNLTTTSENLTSAESSIRDTNMAQAMMEFTKLNILNQASQSMLAQANQLPQGVLSLLR